jgi:hypothetical protein
MVRHRVSSLAVAVFVAGGAVALGAMGAGASRRFVARSSAAPPPRVSSQVHDNAQIGIQMSMLDRRAKFDMILFTGTFDRGDRQLAALALSVSAR